MKGLILTINPFRKILDTQSRKNVFTWYINKSLPSSCCCKYKIYERNNVISWCKYNTIINTTETQKAIVEFFSAKSANKFCKSQIFALSRLMLEDLTECHSVVYSIFKGFDSFMNSQPKLCFYWDILFQNFSHPCNMKTLVHTSEKTKT